MNTAPANIVPPGVTVFCDPTLGPAMRSLDRISRRQAGAPLSVLSAPAMLMLAQIQRHTRNDVLFTLSGAMDFAVSSGLVKQETRVDGFANQLVLASLAGSGLAAKDKAGPEVVLASSRIAVTDNTVASGLDGRAVLDDNGLTRAAGNRVIGGANTADVAFLITTGIVDIGLVYLTDVKADERLIVLASLTADPALTNYAAAVNAKAVSPNAQAALSVMRSTEGSAVLRAKGLEIVS
ncbi:MAG: substrate-binding domain-containing protein [Acidocella sp.]|nr:substrate-binding domain-containing protein [Acidocella sp.]